MNRQTERRTDLRHICKAPVSIQESNSAYIYRGRMVNYSNKGMYIEADIAMDGTVDLIVGIEDSKFTSPTGLPDNPMFFNTKILWQKDLKNSIFNFGYGTKIVSVADHLKTLDTKPSVGKELRRHPRKSCHKQVLFTWNDQYSKGIIDNISRGGVSILTKGRLTVGQKIRFVLPGTKYDKGVMLKGEVVYTSLKGVGVKIIGVLKKKKSVEDEFRD